MSDPPDLPPVAAHSSLLAVAPASPPPSDFGSSAFDTSELEHALHRSQQIASSSGLRRAVSAPHSLDRLAGQVYLKPSGGPMRRVATSLGMRRAASFFWSPSAHHDFERAVTALCAKGVGGESLTATLILPFMHNHPEVQLHDIEKHIQKKRIVTNRLIMQLQNHCPDGMRCHSPSSKRTNGPLPAVAEEPSLLAAGCSALGHAKPPHEQLEQQRIQWEQQWQQHRQLLAR
mmetsp:Transcript_22467/g.54015  ORF Transcript_22467/g.54015 Transcript_22467/m.54015 type:complete len:231 (-) Transcript_22467:703-1395(-)